MNTDNFKYGIILFLVSLAGIFFLLKSIKDDQKYKEEDGQALGGNYGSYSRKFKLLIYLIINISLLK